MDSRVFAFVGAKGGCGTTMICTDVSKVISKQKPVLLIDGDLTGRRNLAVIFDAVRQLDLSRETSPVGVHRLNGITLAEIAPTYDAAFTMRLEQVETFMQADAQETVVIADTPSPFAAAVRPIIMRATRVFIVVEPTLLGLSSAHTLLDDLTRFGVPRERVAAIRSSRNGHATVTAQDIEHALSIKVLAELPPMSDRSFAKALEKLVRAIDSLQTEATLLNLLPSTNGSVVDRRSVPRTPESAASTNGAATATHTDGAVRRPQSESDLVHDKFKVRIHSALSKRLNMSDASLAHTDGAKLAELRQSIEEIAGQVLSESTDSDFSAEEIASIKEEILSETLGLGPLEDLMRDPAVTEIMVNGPNVIFVERGGRLDETDKRFASAQQLRLIIERIIAPLGRRLDESSPMVDARLPDGSRVHAIVEPLAIDGAALTIRRFGTRRLTAQDLIDKGSAVPQVLEFLQACIKARLNILISGGTGSGKTTFLNILSAYIPPRERIVTIEDAAELCLNQPNIVRLESRPANVEGRGQIPIRELVRNALRMRPDRIIVGEVRGAEALDMLQARNTGHDGSLTTVHANSPRDAIARVETMVMMAGFDLPIRAIREQIASAINIVIQTVRMRDGSRRIVSVSEIVGMEGEVVTMQELLRFAQHGVDDDEKVKGEFQFTGVQPQCLSRFTEYGVTYDVRELAHLAAASSIW